MKNKSFLCKQVIRQIMMIMVTLFIFVTNSLSIYAAEDLPNLDKTGSISVTLLDKKNQKTVGGGEMTLYQVASAKAEDGSFGYEYVNGFEECGIQLNNLADSELAGKLESKLSDSAKGITKNIDTNGNVKYTNLSTGLYLLIQTKESTGYSKVKSFLVSVPLKEGGVWIYDVDATPKVGTITSTQPNVPKTPNTYSNIGGKLPQTGQLDWPIPVLSIAGMLLFSIGWMLRKGAKKS